MQIIQAYKGKFELTQSQKDTLLSQAKELKMLGYDFMLVDVFKPPFSDTYLTRYTAYCVASDFTRYADIGKRGALSNGLGVNTKKGYGMKQGNSLEYTIPNIGKFEHVVTI
jgi:hypothetical protein